MDKQARPPSRPGLARGRSVGLMLAAGLMCLAAGYFAGASKGMSSCCMGSGQVGVGATG